MAKAERGRVSPPRASSQTGEFRKDWTRLMRSGRYDMRRLKTAMMLLIADDALLPPEYRDHALAGNWLYHRECHVGGDFLLIYRLEGPEGRPTVVFVRAGTHADLFE